MPRENLYNVVVNNIQEYGAATVEDRAIPDYRDGLKPVQRRIIWGMTDLGLKPTGGFMKAARTVGNVMGKYHPHGDVAIYQAMVNMANSSEPLVDGEGNWGGPDDSAAAMRYTEARLTEYSHTCLVDPVYLRVMNYLPNYDGSFQEPLILPARLPNLLLNGASGIAVAVTTRIPAFERKGVVKLVQKALDGEEITPSLCYKHLIFTGPYGGIGDLVSTKKEIKYFFKKGYESLAFRPKRKIDLKAGTYTILSQTPHFAIGNVHAPFSALPSVAAVEDLSSSEERIKLVITLKSSFRKDAKDIFEKFDTKLTRKVPYAINVTERLLGKEPDEHQVQFRSTTIPDLIMDWVTWRVELEVQVLNYLKEQLLEQIARQELILTAIKNLNKLIKIIRKKHPNREALVQAVAKLLKTNIDAANTVLGMTLNTLSNLSKAETETKQKHLHGELLQIKRDLKNPSLRVKTQLHYKD